MKLKLALMALAGAATLAATSAQATSLVVNGSFESATGTGQFDNNNTVTGWSSNGYNFLFAPGTADTTGAAGQFGNLTLWGPNNGSANGLPATSPDGGNYVAADGAFQVAPITQTITGLIAGKSYVVGFYWAGAQQNGFTGATTEQWEVGLGSGPTQSTVIVNNLDHGFTGWMHQSFTFVADGSSDVLSFMAHGTPDGVPPFSLLDGVTLRAAVPEPASWALMIVGFGAVGGLSRRRRKALAAA